MRQSQRGWMLDGMPVKRIGLTAISAIILLMSACSTGQGSDAGVPAPVTRAAPTQDSGLSAQSDEIYPLQEEKLYVALIWHQHQPVYFKDPQSGLYEKPWVRLHAAKDYVDMATTLQAYPRVHATFNLTPSLILQLDDIGQGAKDLYWAHAEIPARELSPEQKKFILERFFDINPKIIARFPRYQELAAMRGEGALFDWSPQDFRDLQVLFNLAWTDPDWLAQEPLASMVAQGRNYSEADKQVVFDRHLELVRQVVPLHAQMQRLGQIEVTMTPYAHPILPLLVDSNLAREAMPDAELPSRFVYGQDAVAQVELGVEVYEDHFGQTPRGMWPSEGAVAQSIVSMVSGAGIRWMASDEQVLADSLPQIESFTRDHSDTLQQADLLYQPYSVQGVRGDPVAILFRDHLLSDKVGFEYSGSPGKEAAEDFVGRLEAIRIRLEQEGAQGPHLVTVLLDGENAWEHYDEDGKVFLNEMYRLLATSETLVTVTPSQYLDALEDHDYEPPQIETLASGSWIDGTYSTWIGEEEENRAWEYLKLTRDAVRDRADSLGPEALEEALQFIYLAEGSDWFWWYGADQNSGSDEAFDQQFRSYLEQVFLTIGQQPPGFVNVPVMPHTPQPPDQEPMELIMPSINGFAAEGEWEDAGWYALSDPLLSDFYYGFDQQNLYLRIDGQRPIEPGTVLGFYLNLPEAGPINAYSRFGEGESLLGFGIHRVIEVTWPEGVPVVSVYRAAGAGQWEAVDTSGAPAIEAAASGGTLEVAVPFLELGSRIRSGDRIHARLVVSQKDQDVGIFPALGPALATVPDLPVSNVFLDLSDPSHDDSGPGSYEYPTDEVFKAGVFDLTGLMVGYDDEDYIFRVQFRGPVTNEWGSPNGLSVQTIDIYIDRDGPSSGSRMLLPGRNASLTDDYAWDYVIWAEGWTPGVYSPGEAGPVQIDSGFRIVTNPGQRRVTIRVAKRLLEGDPLQWRLAVAILSQEGFPSSGVWRVRDVQPERERWRIGGGSGSTADTRIMDILWPSDEEVSQQELLTHSIGPEAELEDLEPDDYPQVPMLGP